MEDGRHSAAFIISTFGRSTFDHCTFTAVVSVNFSGANHTILSYIQRQRRKKAKNILVRLENKNFPLLSSLLQR
jgi:hypothetical protein